MKKKYTKGLFILLIVIIISWLLKDTFSQPNAADLDGGFTEKASYRNENNTGPVQHIYSVSVKNPANADFEAYGSLMPHHKYGNTKVYFFKAGEPIPIKLYPGNINFDAIYEPNCIALYEKSAMGNSAVTLSPFIQKLKTP